MAQHHNEPKEDNNFYSLYYIAGLLAGLFVGAIVDRGLIYIPIGGVLGLLTAALFISKLVKGRENAK
ncbi:hypothetical protein GCM10023149_44500 [Mucilaginibacter gynuensis]|uniref:AtpZ/AtpI family protein n=1 Tax=Mucilaginibacter gynuensis TaxID=1302236 RepID=A0ABP8H9K8_9SPHI